MLRTHGDLVSSFFFMALALLYFAGTFDFIEISRVSSGAKILPYTYAIMLFAAALHIFVRACKKRRASAAQAQNAAPESGVNYRKIVLTLVLIALYALLFNSVGFVGATLLFLVLQMLVLSGGQGRNIRLIAVTSVMATLLLYYIFTHIFLIAFPEGMWF